MKTLSIFGLAFGLFMVFSQVGNANAESYKSDQKIVEDVNDIMMQMSDVQREAVLKQAAIIEQKLRNMSQKERDELINTVREIGSSIDLEKVNATSLEKVSPSSLEDTMKNFKEYQKKF